MNLKLKFARIRNGLSQLDVANSLGVSKQAISDYETGKYLPKPKNMNKMASIYGSSVQDLFFSEDH